MADIAPKITSIFQAVGEKKDVFLTAAKEN